MPIGLKTAAWSSSYLLHQLTGIDAPGGFSTRTASVAGFRSPAVEWIIIVFMLLAGMSFVQHYRLFVERRPRAFFSDLRRISAAVG